ncbi:acyl-CoA dehydrogenase [Paralimibaculum aggregatum]|uniref:Acyl-CoA dehydrogenase n=1 Tax=Paralimibaculum aggregatum TaxID=3036245 RepID=A0ABQ6LIP4_9RHOB|nr:acyl-CoA dehydrogenase family protein [Limibaculum sp. NKW23]GMG82100.1 acyl-CoA dehydrogenase [Limibaculum sp. NKW23]
MTDPSELAMLRDSAAGFAAGERDLFYHQREFGRLPGVNPAAFRKMADLGWMGILVPEEHDGLGLGLPEMGTVVRELGKALLAEPLVATAVLGARILAASPDTTLKARLLPGLAAGEHLACLAFQGPAGSLDDLGSAVRPADGRLTGQSRFVAGASLADSFLVAARGDAGLGIYLVDARSEGLAVSYEWRSDGTCLGRLALDGAEWTTVVAEGEAAETALAEALDMACIVASAEMLGVMEATLDLTLDYMRTRVQFDRPIGSFQALQHKVVDLYILKEIASGVLQEALASGARPPAERSLLASRVKSRCSDAVLRITRECIQLHGAIGFTSEYELGAYVYRAIALAAWLGNGAEHRRRIRALSARPQEGETHA